MGQIRVEPGPVSDDGQSLPCREPGCPGSVTYIPDEEVFWTRSNPLLRRLGLRRRVALTCPYGHTHSYEV